ncbi:MAG: hypothetical protein HEQ40_06200 [Lacibacter sp.]|jgi:hypothetical protein
MKLQALFLSILTFIFISCSKNKIDENQSKIVKSEIYLTFNNYEDMFNKISELEQMDSLQFVNWESSKHFKSLKTLLDNANAAINTSIDQEIEAEEQKRKFNDIFFIGKDNQLRLINNQYKLSCILNRDGIVKVGNAFLKFTSKGTISTTSNYDILLGDANELRSNKNVNISSDPTNLNTVFQDADPYNSGTNQYYVFSDRYESANRRFYMELIKQFTYLPSYNYLNQYLGFYLGRYFFVKFSHQRKSLGIWRNSQSSTYVNAFLYTYTEPFRGPLSNPVGPVGPNPQQFTLAYGWDQYQDILKESTTGAFPTAQFISVNNIPQFNERDYDYVYSSLFIRATGDGGQNWYEKSFSGQ